MTSYVSCTAAYRALLSRRTQIIVAVRIISPPLGERDARPASAKDSKRQDEERQETGAVKGTGDEVAVVLEDARMVVAQVVLVEEPGDHPAEEDAGLGLVVREEAGVLQKLWKVQLVQSKASDFRDELGKVGR